LAVREEFVEVRTTQSRNTHCSIITPQTMPKSQERVSEAKQKSSQAK
jgi:hypothetical protein